MGDKDNFNRGTFRALTISTREELLKNGFYKQKGPIWVQLNSPLLGGKYIWAVVRWGVQRRPLLGGFKWIGVQSREAELSALGGCLCNGGSAYRGFTVHVHYRQ